MDALSRRLEIINILIVRRHTTANELAQEFGVSSRTIQSDIQTLSSCYPVYTKPGVDGGIFITDNYKPYVNTLSSGELQTLCELYDKADGQQKKHLHQIISKYGPDKLEL